MKQMTLTGTVTKIHDICGKPMRLLDVYGEELKRTRKSYFCDSCVMGITININNNGGII